MSRVVPEHGEPVTVILGDPNSAARAQLAELLARLECSVVEAATESELLRAAWLEEPALVVLDVELGTGFAYECCRALRERYGEELPIVFLSEYRVAPADEVAGLLLGADEYLAKPVNPDVFTARMRRMLVRSRLRGKARTSLTPRESEVLSLLVAGLPTPKIAQRLCITTKTTATHIEHILAKMGAHSRAQAVAFALRDRLVDVAA